MAGIDIDVDTGHFFWFSVAAMQMTGLRADHAQHVTSAGLWCPA
jgi:hypothetical protein